MSEWIHFHSRKECQWGNHAGIYARGGGFAGGHFLPSGKLAEHCSGAGTPERFEGMLHSLNGFFAVVAIHADTVFAAVDHARSIPLFYAIEAEQLFVSDDAYWVREQLGASSFDPAAEQEFALSGYTTGPDTLDARIKQLQAGEMLVAQRSATGMTWKTRFYCRYLHQDRMEWPEDRQRDKLDEVLVAAFERFIKYAGGRMIAVPLSGGYDSLLIVLMLKRLGYENVLAFSYGRQGNGEARASRSAADVLGVRWEFVPYSEELWQQWFHTTERRTYYRYADNLCSLPVLQDWPAVWTLKQRKVLPDDAVLAPGYSADAFPASRKTGAGSAVYQDKRAVRETVYQAIYSYTYFLEDWGSRRAQLQPLIDRRIEAALGGLERFSTSAYAVEAWGIQERQAKFITNAVRVYEFWGYDWWLPLWDRDFADYWSRVPSRFRIERRFSRQYIADLYQQQTGAELKRGIGRGRLTPVQQLAAGLRWAGQHMPLVSTVYDYFRARLKYRSHPLAWHGMIPQQLFLKHFTGRANINTYLVKEWLGRSSFTAEEE